MKTSKKLDVLAMFRKLKSPRPGIVIYNVMFRNAGCGIMWHEKEREEHPPIYARNVGQDSWRNGLVVYRYYPTFERAVREEFKRLFPQSNHKKGK